MTEDEMHQERQSPQKYLWEYMPEELEELGLLGDYDELEDIDGVENEDFPEDADEGPDDYDE